MGGYFYDQHFGPYPWWGPGLYQYPYFPVYGLHANVRVLATPKEAAVYVDGFYAGVVDDFDSVFQSLPLPSGGHDITLYYPGYRTVSQRVYLSPGSTFKLHQTMERLPAGSVSEPPPVAPPVPPPPQDSFVAPRTLPHNQPAAAARGGRHAAGGRIRFAEAPCPAGERRSDHRRRTMDQFSCRRVRDPARRRIASHRGRRTGVPTILDGDSGA